ncbi:MAG: translocation/assembly module TamB [Parachlamydiaceae bacterium]|nr:translocation/assembly module TamB [Parachlamydiaceae bacterium]
MNILKRILQITLAFLLLVLLLWIIVAGTLQSEKGRQWVLGHIIHYVEKETGADVSVQKVDFILPLRLRLQKISVKKDGVPITFINNLDLDCSPTQLLNGRLIFSLIHAHGIKVLDFHSLIKEQNSSKPNETWDHPLPFYVKIEKIRIEDLDIAPTLIDKFIEQQTLAKLVKESKLSFEGMITNNPFRSSIWAHLSIIASSFNNDHPPLKFLLDIKHKNLTLSFETEKFPISLFSSKIPENTLGNISVEAFAPIRIWNSFFSSSHPDVDAIEGSFKAHLKNKSSDTSSLNLIGKKTTLEGKFKIPNKNKIHIYESDLVSPNLNLRGAITLNTNSTIENGAFKGEILSLNTIFQHYSLPEIICNDVLVNGSIKGDLLTPSIWLQTKCPSADFKNHHLRNIITAVTINLNDAGAQGSTEVYFEDGVIPGQFASNFEYYNSFLRLSDLHLNALDVQGTGNLNISTKDFIGNGHLDLITKDLKKISALTSNQISGEGRLRLSLMASQMDSGIPTQGLNANIYGNNIAWKDLNASEISCVTTIENLWTLENDGIPLHTHITIKDFTSSYAQAQNLVIVVDNKFKLDSRAILDTKCEITGDNINGTDFSIEHLKLSTGLSDPQNSYDGTIQFNCQNITYNDLILSELSGETEINSLTQEQWPFKLLGTGKYNENLHFDLKGQWNLNSKKVQMLAETCSGQLGPFPYHLINPFQLTYHNGTNKLNINSMKFAIGNAEFNLDFNLDKQEIHCKASGDKVPSELIRFIAPTIPAIGHLSFFASLNGPLKKPLGQVKLSLDQFSLLEEIFANRPSLDGEIVLDIEKNGTKIQGSLLGLGKNPVKAQGTLPLNISLAPFSIISHDELPFHVMFQAEGELDPFLHLFYNDTTNLSGQAKIAVTLHGNMNEPKVQGEIDLFDGAYESLSTGAIYKNITARIEGDGSKLILKDFSAQDIKQGAITASGTLLLDVKNNYPFEFNIKPTQIYILDSDYAKIAASGNLRLIGDKKQGTLTGNLTTDQASISMEEALPTQVKSIDFKYVNIPEGSSSPQTNTKDASWPLQLNININLPSGVMITGQNLQSEWRGEIALTGTPPHPMLNGELRIFTGEYDFRGKKFSLTQGNIHFAGPPGKKTTLYVVASKEIDKIQADIIVKGPADKLAISFRSNPPLSQREILSYILFGRGISDITSDQGDLLTHSFVDINANIKDDKNTPDILTRLRNNMGIDRLDFTTSDNENKDMGVQVGKYISESVLISYNKSINTATNRVAIEAKLLKNLRVQGEVGDDEEGKILLKWKKDY